jgi:capsular exopolysaccharide synthesis family protein
MNDYANMANDPRDTKGHLVTIAQNLPAARDPYGPLVGYVESSSNEADQLAAKFFECWRIFKKRKWLILSIAAAFVTLNAVRTLMQTPLYTATVRLQIDTNVAQIVEGDNITRVEDPNEDFMGTQFQLLQSRSLAERVVSSLKLVDDPDFLKPRDFSIIGALTGSFSSSPSAEDPMAREPASVGTVMGNVRVRPVVNSRLVDIDYSDPVPERAQRIANAYADAFLASNLDKRFQANASAKIFLEDKIAQLKLKLEDSEKRLLDFAKQQEIVDVNDKTSIAESNLASANAALGNLIAERTKNEQLWHQVETADAIDLPQFLTNEVIQGLRRKRNELALEYQQKLQTFKPSFPAMQQIQNQIDEIDKQLAAEVQTIKDSFKASYESSLALESEMQDRITKLKQDVLELQNRSIRYNILKREADTNRDLYASLLQRFKEVDVASGVVSNNLFIVDRATAPGAPSTPNLRRAMLIALLVGLCAAMGAAYVLERLDDKIRAPEQLEVATGLSTLGIIPKVPDVDQELADLRSALSEAYRSLCTTLQFTTESGLPRTLCVTSSGAGEGKSLTAYSVAKHFALLGRSVLLVDADLRNPSLHKRLNRENSVGLSSYLVGACAPPDAMQSTGIPKLAFMASGPLPPNAADLLGSSRLYSLLSIGLEVFDLIVVDGPPVLGLADAQLLSAATAATVFIVGAGQSRTGVVRAALRRLQQSRGTIIGAVLTKYDSKSLGYGYGYGDAGYGYGHGYGEEAAPRGLSVGRIAKRAAEPQLTDAREGS